MLNENVKKLLKAGMWDLATCAGGKWNSRIICVLAALGTLRPEDMTEEEARALTIRLHEMGAKSVVVTSAKVDGENCVVGYDGTEGEFFRIPFDLIPVRFVGTGDIFAAVMLGWLVDGVPLQESTHRAMDAVRTMIDRNRDKEDKYLGIPIETCLEVPDE